MYKIAALAIASLPVTLLADWPTEKTVFDRGAIDIRVSYFPGDDEWAFGIDDKSGSGVFHDPADTILLARPESRAEVPSDTNWSFLGEPGDPVWILGPNTGRQYLDPGLNSEVTTNPPGGVSESDISGEIALTLIDYEGPGNFFLYQPLAGQPPEIYMDTRPEEGPYGHFPLYPESHSHRRWAFTERGIYFLVMQPSGTRAADGEPTTGEPPTDFTFLVDPLPVHWWLLEYFDREANQPVAALDADPDGDGVSNLLEYAFALDPLDPSRGGLPKISLQEVDGTVYLVIEYRRPADRSDLHYSVEASSNLADWEELDPDALTVSIEPDEDETERVTVRDTLPLAESSRRFLRTKIAYVGAP